jgi:hypothetical protein
MQFKLIQIAEASDNQLRDFVAMMGAEAGQNEARPNLEAKIQQLSPGLTAIRLPDTGAPFDFEDQGGAPVRPEGYVDRNVETVAPGLSIRTEAGPRIDPRVLIQINNDENNGEVNKEDVPVGVNGVVWQLKRGMPLDVPYRVLLVLMDAKRQIITHSTAQDNEGEVVTSIAYAYPFVVIKPADPEEVRAWHAAVDHVELA